MRKLVLIFIVVLTAYGVHGQEVEVEKKQGVKNFNLIKIGSSFQFDLYYIGMYDYYYDDYGWYDNYRYPDGANTTLYVGYEHIWEFQNKTAIALEPKIGISFREFANHAMIGNDIKFYWANHEIWRMGIAVSTDYIYGSHDTFVTVPMDNGNYYQRIDVKMRYHNTSIDIAIIPFQFRFRNVPIVIESQFSLAGFSILATRSQNYSGVDGKKTHTYDADIYPYFIKGELKIGYVFP